MDARTAGKSSQARRGSCAELLRGQPGSHGLPLWGSTCCSLHSCPARDIVGSGLALTAWFKARRGSCTPRAGWPLTALPYETCGDHRWKEGASAWHCYRHPSLGSEGPFPSAQKLWEGTCSYKGIKTPQSEADVTMLLFPSY